jgi:hypothetical protein
MGHQQLRFIFLGVVLVGIALLTEYLSTTNTSTWAAVKNDLPGTIDKSVVISDNNTLAGTSDRGGYLSANNGSTCFQVNNGFSNLDNRSLAVSGNNIFVGTYGGSALLRHIYEISPVEHKGFSAMVKQRSIQFK